MIFMNYIVSEALREHCANVQSDILINDWKKIHANLKWGQFIARKIRSDLDQTLDQCMKIDSMSISSRQNQGSEQPQSTEEEQKQIEQIQQTKDEMEDDEQKQGNNMYISV